MRQLPRGNATTTNRGSEGFGPVDVCSVSRSVDVGRVEETATEFIVDGKWHFIKDEAMPAQDGQYHAWIWGGKPRCFFYPMNV